MISIAVAIGAMILSVYAFYKRRQADKHLIELIIKEGITSPSSENILDIDKEAERLRIRLEHDINSRKNKSSEGQQEIMEHQIRTLKLEFFRSRVLELSRKLSPSDRAEVLEAINRSSAKGSNSYLNSILEQSQSTDFKYS